MHDRTPGHLSRGELSLSLYKDLSKQFGAHISIIAVYEP